MSNPQDKIVVSLDRREAIAVGERLLSSGDQSVVRVANSLLAAARPGPDQINIDGRYDSRTSAIRYLGFATRQTNGLYRVIADVGGALCIVEVSLHFDSPSAEVLRVAIGEDVAKSPNSEDAP